MGIRALKAAWAAVAISVVAAGCATLDSRPPQEIVKERAQERAAAVVAGDTKQVYSFFTPTVRNTLKYEDYASNVRVGFWKAATVDKVVCPKEDVCDVSLSIEYIFRGMRIKTPVGETWIREGREWWYATKE